MILFKQEHVEPIIHGRKTQTRRLGNRRWRDGAVHACYTKPPFAKGGSEPFVKVTIQSIHKEWLLDISDEDAKAEGYWDKEKFLDAFYRINPDWLLRSGALAESPKVWVVEFAIVPGTEAFLSPFSTGSEFCDWENTNCYVCASSGMDEQGEYTWGRCPMEDALTEACVGDGFVPAKLAQEHGWTRNSEWGYPEAPNHCTRKVKP